MARVPNVRIPGEAPKLDEVEAEPEAREAPASAHGEPEPTPRRAVLESPKGQLPDAADIDVNALRKAVLTRQGWICPLPENDAAAQSPAGRR